MKKGVFDFFKIPDVNAGVADYFETPDAVLLDVRTREEFNEGHIPESINLPLDEIVRAEGLFDKNKTIFTYCRSGARSSRAAEALRRMKFNDVRNIGGMMNYRGKIERQRI